MMNTSTSRAVCSLYRSCIRQIRILPHSYLRQFFALRARDDIEKVLSFKAPSLRKRNMKTISKVLNRILKANQGDVKSFQHLLGIAYGRKGKLKWELLEPFMYSNGPSPDRIIPGKESSRPPMFSPELTALLTSPHSRTTKPLNKSDIIMPRNLPARADPLSDDARVYGVLSKRRQVNIRWRQFREETKKLLPPLGARVTDAVNGKSQFRVRHAKLEHLENVESAVGELCKGPTKTRRERNENIEINECPAPLVYRHPSRWVRRRYRWLLSRSPRLVYRLDNSLSVQMSPRSFSPYQKSATYLPEVDRTTVAWFRKPIVTKKS